MLKGNKKFKNIKGLIILFFLFITGVVIVLIRNMLLTQSNETEKFTSNFTSTNQEEKRDISEKVEGEYTFYNNGFHFRYPINIFRYQMDYEWGVRLASQKLQYYIPVEVKGNGLMISFSTNKINDTQLNRFENEYKQPTGALLDGYKVKAIKVKNSDIGSYQGYIVELFSEGEEPNINGYYASWQKENILYYLSLNASSRENLEKNFQLFEEIISTITFENLPIQ